MTILQAPELRRIYATARAALRASSRPYFLPRLIQRIVLQFQANRSVSEATAILTASLELFQHEIDLRYSMVRYTIWVLPTLGFVGTVLGISQALRSAGAANPRDPYLLQELTQILAVKFDTTLVALRWPRCWFSRSTSSSATRRQRSTRPASTASTISSTGCSTSDRPCAVRCAPRSNSSACRRSTCSPACSGPSSWSPSFCCPTTCGSLRSSTTAQAEAETSALAAELRLYREKLTGDAKRSQ